jgi:hypothetical protein
MISAMHPGGAELYITYHCWVDRWENSCFWVHKSKRKAHAAQSLAKCIKISRADLILASTAFALVHNSLDDLGDASRWCGTVYRLSLLGGQMGKIVLFFGCTRARGTYIARQAHAGTVIGEVP